MLDARRFFALSTLLVLTLFFAATAVAQISFEGVRVLHQDLTGFDDQPEQFDNFGSSFAIGDFDADGSVDLLIGVPGETVVPDVPAGAAHVLLGPDLEADPLGIFFVSQQTWAGHVDEPYEEFSRSLAAGDFDGDGRDSLVFGVPSRLAQGSAGEARCGVVLVAEMGASIPFPVAPARYAPTIPECDETDQFGVAVVVGDFDGDTYDDLAIGAHLDELENDPVQNHGVVDVYFGSLDGLVGSSRVRLSPGTAPIGDSALGGGGFGVALAAGDFDGDGRDDLVIGAPSKQVDEVSVGAVYVLAGAADRFATSTAVRWTQSEASAVELPEANDAFGGDLATGDLNGDGYADLAIGAAREHLAPGDIQSGIVHVLFGALTGLGTGSLASIDLTRASIPGGADQEGAQFGYALTIADFNADGRADLAIGAPQANGGVGDVAIIPGTSTGLNTSEALVVNDQLLGLGSTAGFGTELAAADFDGDGAAELLVGVPKATVGSVSFAGSVRLIDAVAGSIFEDGFELGVEALR